MRRNAGPGGPGDTDGPFAAKWRDLHHQAERIALLAGLSPEPFKGPIAAFPSRIDAAPEWQQRFALRAMEDIEMMMRPGIEALEILHQRGASARAPALALWREFYNARCSLISLAEREPA